MSNPVPTTRVTSRAGAREPFVRGTDLLVTEPGGTSCERVRPRRDLATRFLHDRRPWPCRKPTPTSQTEMTHAGAGEVPPTSASSRTPCRTPRMDGWMLQRRASRSAAGADGFPRPARDRVRCLRCTRVD
eukprot:549477-Prymnesium_polylepis.1